MARNIEIKARVDDMPRLAARVAALAGSGPVEIEQDDTFFVCAAGRLKLRAFSSTEGELIFYQRADQPGPKESFYLRTPTQTPDLMRHTLTLACGQAGRVTKHRTLYLVDRTRVHLDQVEGLGNFMELEVVLQADESLEAGVAEAQSLMTRLGIQPSELVDAAYVDLMAHRTCALA